MILLYSSGSAGTGSQVNLSDARSTDLVIQVLSGSYGAGGVRVFGSVTGHQMVALPGYSVTGSVASPFISTFFNDVYVIPNVGGLTVEARVGGSGSVWARAVTR